MSSTRADRKHDRAFGTRSSRHSVRLPRPVCEPVPPSRSAVPSAWD